MILDCLLMGMTYAQIAQQLFMSVDTVRTGVRKLYATLGCDETTLLSVCKNAGWHRPY
jgi:DNA-binding NarL/FixJ family response regulator